MKYAIHLSQYMSMRYSKLSSLQDSVIAFENFPGKERSSTFFDDIQGDSADWRNRCLANYFGLERVYLNN